MSIDFDKSIDSEPEEDPVEDGDTVKDIKSFFKASYYQSHQESTSLKRKYIQHAAASEDFMKIAVGLENEMQVYDVTRTGLSKYVGKNDFGKFDHQVSGLRFLRGDHNMILASTIAGEIHLYDLRTFSRVHTFEGNSYYFFTSRKICNNNLFLDDTEVVVKPVNCFDVNVDNHFICAGTDELNHDVYLLFFDIRERRFMGGFFESHQEEVTDVKFHPTKPELLASTSTDGLINVFDCLQQSEDDALQFSLNTEDSVAKIQWHNHDRLSCITNTNNLHLYDVESQDLLKKWERDALTEGLKRKSAIDIHVHDCYDFGNDEMMFLASSNFNKGECLRSMKFDEKSLLPNANFTGNSQIIRTTLFNEKDNMFYTFGEGAIISIWKEGEESSTQHLNSKEESSIKKKVKSKSKPY